MVTGPLLVLLCAAAPEVAAWLEEAAAVAPIDDVDPAVESANAATHRVRTVAQATAPALRAVRRPTVHVVTPVPPPPEEAPRARALIGTSPANPRGPPRA